MNTIHRNDQSRSGPPADGSEPRATLEREADLARQAMSQKFDELKRSLETAADPREWARRHPWAAIGAAAAAGFAAAVVIAAPRKQPPPAAPAMPTEAASVAGANPAGRHSRFADLFFDLAKVLITTHLRRCCKPGSTASWRPAQHRMPPPVMPQHPAPPRRRSCAGCQWAVRRIC